MTEQTVPFRQLLDRIEAGDPSAAHEFVDDYGPHICRAIRRRFRDGRFRMLYSTEECMQSVWASVFSDVERLRGIENRNHLIAYLAKVASHKLMDRHKHLRNQRNNIGRECPLPDSFTADQLEFIATEPSPSQRVALQDEYEHQTSDLSSKQRTIFSMFINGHTSEEISQRLDGQLAERSVRQIISDVVQRLRRRSKSDCRFVDRR